MFRKVLLTAAALTLLSAGSAFAQTAALRTRVPTPATPSTPAFTTRNAFTADDAQWGPQGGRQSLAWDQRGRWGVRLDLDQPVDRDRGLNDVEAGAYVRLNRSLSVGGALRLDEQPALSREVTPRDRNARVRVETRLQF